MLANTLCKHTQSFHIMHIEKNKRAEGKGKSIQISSCSHSISDVVTQKHTHTHTFHKYCCLCANSNHQKITLSTYLLTQTAPFVDQRFFTSLPVHRIRTLVNNKIFLFLLSASLFVYFHIYLSRYSREAQIFIVASVYSRAMCA
jgi:hypothetical protein